MTLYYLAQPYSINSDESIRERRHDYAVKKVAEYLSKGYNVFSPILNSHLPALRHNLPNDWNFWQNIDKTYIALCSELWVLMMDQWERSVGLTAEIKYAESIGIPIKYIECPDEFEQELEEVA